MTRPEYIAKYPQGRESVYVAACPACAGWRQHSPAEMTTHHPDSGVSAT